MVDSPRTPTPDTSFTATTPDILPPNPTKVVSGMSNIPESAPKSMVHDRQVFQRKASEKK